MRKRRLATLQRILLERRREIHGYVRGRMRDARVGQSTEGRDDPERSEADTQGSIEFTLLHMRAATLARIDEALVRLDAGNYGTCAHCDGEISEPRLRALPFAVRCHVCEVRLEGRDERVEQRSRQALLPSLFGPDGFGV